MAAGNEARAGAKAGTKAGGTSTATGNDEVAPSHALNADPSRPVCVRLEEVPWQPSPSGTVWRRRLHLEGPSESGRVTSVVRYEPGATFPLHPHPEGEEILVLEGVFSDEHGDFPAGSYLLNPEGVTHAPRSGPGCLLFVKLRQYPGPGRERVALRTDRMAWRAIEGTGAGFLAAAPGTREAKDLYRSARHPERGALERWAPGAALGPRSAPGGIEYLLLEGSFGDELGEHAALEWIRYPARYVHAPRAGPGGAVVLVKWNHLGSGSGEEGAR